MSNQLNSGDSEPDKLERLRERTDEVELIISGLTILALFTLPGWLFEQLSAHTTHLSETLSYAGNVIMVMVTGLCYVLGGCFLIHLLTRAYWIGLIGLRTTFPDGINWSRTPGLGPMTRAHYREHLPDLKTAIARADRLASSLFAVISLIALSVLWVSAIILLTLLLSGIIGGWFGDFGRGVDIGLSLILLFGVGIPALLWLLDTQVVARWPQVESARWFSDPVRAMIRFTGYMYPQRLVLPVQLTLQSNTKPMAFIVLFGAGMVVITMLGQTRWDGWYQFTLSSQFRYLGEQSLEQGIISSHYEDWRTEKDRVRPWPMISAFEQGGGQVRLFLPYWPVRDNPVLDRLCADDAEDAVACLRLIWQVSINGRPVSLDGFLATERMDLGMRGLTGLVPVTQLNPGLHTIEIQHDPNTVSEETNGRSGRGMRFHIPFKFAPQYELDLKPPTPARDDEAAAAEAGAQRPVG